MNHLWDPHVDINNRSYSYQADLFSYPPVLSPTFYSAVEMSRANGLTYNHMDVGLGSVGEIE
jgi:hypothetical protein